MVESNPVVLFTREEHGNLPVIAYPPASEKGAGSWRYKVETEEGLISFDSFEQLKRNCYGEQNNLHWTHDRYFRVGEKWSSGIIEPAIPTTVLFAPKPGLLTVSSPHVEPLPGENLLTVASSAEGIDLQVRHMEITKLLFAGYRNTIARNNLDPEEVLQEVRLGLEKRNRGKSRWDPNRSKFGYYVNMVCGSILNNMLRKQILRNSHESTGILAFRENRMEVMDVREAEHLADCQIRLTEYEDREALESFGQWLVHQPGGRKQIMKTALQILPHMYAGCGVSDICLLTGMERKSVSAAIKALRAVSGPYFGR